MEAKVDREELLPALSWVCGAIEKRQPLPILGNILLRAERDRLELVGTDLEIEIRSWCEAKVERDGSMAIPARKILDIIRNLPEGSEIAVKGEDEKLRVTSGRGRYVLGTLPAEDFPELQGGELEEIEISVKESELKRLLEKTSFAMAQQDVRFYLNGLLLQVKNGVITGVATDGHRLARYDLKIDGGRKEEEASVIVPYKTIGELRRICSVADRAVRILLGARVARFELENVVITSKLVDGKYPDFERVIPVELSKVAIVEKEGLKRSLVRAAVLSNEKFRGVRIAFEGGMLRLQAHNPEQEEAIEELELEFEGEATSIGFNVAYLSDVLSAVTVDRVEVHFEDGDSSSIWRGVGEERECFVVMPMRI